MRVLTIVRNFGQRGTQRVAENFSAAYVRLGHEVNVLAFEHQGPRLTNYVQHGVHVLPAYRSSPDEALSQASAFDPELIHIHRSGVTQPAETQLLRALKKAHNCVLETNVFSRFDPDADPYIDLHGQLTHAGLYRWQSLENGRSRGVGFYLPDVLNYDVWNRPSPEHARELRLRLSIPPDAIILGTIGKTHPGLRGVVTRLISTPQPIYWVLVESEEARKLVFALPTKLQAFCRLLPATDSDQTLTHYYSFFDLLLHWSSNGESFGMVLAESIAVGTPVVMPLQLHRDIGGVEVVGHRQGGLIAASGKQLAHACKLAIERLPLLRQRVIEAQTRHHQEYEMLAVAKQATAAARAILGGGDGRGDRAQRLQVAGFVVNVGRPAMDDLIHACLGPRSQLELTLFAAAHSPTFNDVRRSIHKLKRAVGRA